MKQLNRHIYSSSSVWNFLFIENVLLWIVLLHWCIWVFDIQFENPKIQGFFCCFIFSPFLRANILSEQIFFFVFHQKNCFYNFHFFFFEVSNFRNRIFTNHKQELITRTCQWNCMLHRIFYCVTALLILLPK